ncbi:MAG: YigZ family protein [Succinivibrio sp.]
MTEKAALLVPALHGGETVRTELVVKKSRFITTIGRARGVEACREFVAKVSEEFSDARHNCFAFNGGKAGESGFAGCSDDGEPHGTAGQPMLNIILHCGMGEICCVVTRYFGGILLGTGGLVKAYSDSVRQALAMTPSEEAADMVEVSAAFDFRHQGQIMRIAAECGARIASRDFSDRATLVFEVRADAADALCGRISDATSGKAEIRRS